MYLAFKWLMFLVVAMWLGLCYIDVRLKKCEESHKGCSVKPRTTVYKNITLAENVRPLSKTQLHKDQQSSSVVIIHYITFFAGALAVTLYNKKTAIIVYGKQKIAEINFREHLVIALEHLKITAFQLWFAIKKKSKISWKILEMKLHSIDVSRISFYFKPPSPNERNEILLKRLREVGIERNKLGQLLVAAIQDNKKIRMQCQLENMAKTRLMRQNLETQKLIKENRSKYVNFQQLYLVTYQENGFLKSRIKQLSREKEEAESNLIKLVYKIYRSMDCNLKMYCTRIIGKGKLHTNANGEMADLLNKPNGASSTSKCGPKGTDGNFSKTASNSCFGEGSQENDSISRFDPGEPRPKLRGLPGEYVWTIKDKDGIIEKLYEYDYGYDFDNGDTIRRIREYSVYHDKDCLLDFANSRSTTIIHDRESPPPKTVTPMYIPQKPSRVRMPANRRFLTESPVFQQFLENNKNFGVSPSSSLPLISS